MTDDRSLERAARSWIEAGPTRAPDRVVEAAIDLIATTPQERGLRALRPPWRGHTMNRIALFGASAAVVVAVGLGAFYLSGGQPGTVGGQATSPPTSASPPPAAQAIPDGTYTTGPISVADIDRQLDADETLTDAEKESIRTDVLVISGTTTLEILHRGRRNHVAGGVGPRRRASAVGRRRRVGGALDRSLHL